MGCDTKGFVLTKEKNPYEIFKRIKWAIFQEIKRETGIDNVTAVWGENYTMPNGEITDIDGYFRVSFNFAGENRDLSVITSCDNDYSDFKKGKKIILSFGAWGRSVQLMEVALHSLSDLGKTYIQENDCEGDWKPITFDAVQVEAQKEAVTW